MNVALLIETACQSIARSQGLSTVPDAQIYMGSSSPDGGYDGAETTIVLPCIIFHVVSADPYVPRSQARRCRLRTIIRTQRDAENEAIHRARADQVISMVRGETFYVALKAFDGLTILLSVEQGETESQTDRHLETVLEQLIDAVPATIRA